MDGRLVRLLAFGVVRDASHRISRAAANCILLVIWSRPRKTSNNSYSWSFPVFTSLREGHGTAKNTIGIKRKGGVLAQRRLTRGRSLDSLHYGIIMLYPPPLRWAASE